jgi:hypothetical protein
MVRKTARQTPPREEAFGPIQPIVAMTKRHLIENMRQRLASDDRWALRALVRIYHNQTAEEQASEHTIERNGIGFSGPDSEILSSFARQYLQRGRLSDRQMAVLRRKIPSYAKQIVKASDTDRLTAAFSGSCYTQSTYAHA